MGQTESSPGDPNGFLGFLMRQFAPPGTQPKEKKVGQSYNSLSTADKNLIDTFILIMAHTSALKIREEALSEAAISAKRDQTAKYYFEDFIKPLGRKYIDPIAHVLGINPDSPMDCLDNVRGGRYVYPIDLFEMLVHGAWIEPEPMHPTPAGAIEKGRAAAATASKYVM